MRLLQGWEMFIRHSASGSEHLPCERAWLAHVATETSKQRAAEGCPTLALLQRWEMFIRHSASANEDLPFKSDQTSQAMLRRRLPAFHHFELLPPPSRAGNPRPSKPVSRNPQAGPPPLRFCHSRICRDAGALPPTDQRAGEGHAIDRDAGAEAALRAPTSPALANSWRSGPGRTLG